MELTETVERLNNRLADEYGSDTVTGRAIWRIVWSEDQYEMRKTEYSDAGIKLLVPEVRQLPKYKQWIHEKYILERIEYVDQTDPNNAKLTVTKLSYEPKWTFEDKNGNYLPPTWDACLVIIESFHSMIGKPSRGIVKYPDDNAGGQLETQERVNNLQSELFGNETEVGDALAHGDAIVVPNNYSKEVH